MKRYFVVLIGIIGGLTLMARADDPAPPNRVELSQHLRKAKADLVTPEKLFSHIAAELQEGKLNLFYAHFPPSDTNWNWLRGMDSEQRKKMAGDFRSCRLKKILNKHARIYQMPFAGDETGSIELEVHQQPDGTWTVINWPA